MLCNSFGEIFLRIRQPTARGTGRNKPVRVHAAIVQSEISGTLPSLTPDLENPDTPPFRMNSYEAQIRLHQNLTCCPRYPVIPDGIHEIWPPEIAGGECTFFPIVRAVLGSLGTSPPPRVGSGARKLIKLTCNEKKKCADHTRRKKSNIIYPKCDEWDVSSSMDLWRCHFSLKFCRF